MTIKEDPGARRARVFRRMGEGLGAGGTPPGAVDLTPGRRGRFLRAKLFSGSGPPPAPPALRLRAMCDIDGQLDMPAIGKFEISQMDAKSSSTAAAALDHIARAHREPAGQVICEGGHVKILLESNNPPGTCATNARAARQFRDGGAFGRNFCESLWTMRSRAQPHCSDLPRKTALQTPTVQKSKPLSWAKALRDVSGRAPRCWITSAATNAARRAAVR